MFTCCGGACIAAPQHGSLAWVMAFAVNTSRFRYHRIFVKGRDADEFPEPDAAP